MSGRVLLDTNIVIALFAGEPEVLENLRRQDAAFLCVPVIGELRYGALASSRVEHNLARLDTFSRAAKILPCDLETAAFYARVKHGLRKKGRPIPENDVWIAAVACQHQLQLITRDSHFKDIEKLSVHLW